MRTPLLLSLLALALAACGRQDATPAAVPRTDADGNLRYGSVVFKPDPYGRDAAELRALDQPFRVGRRLDL